MMRERRSLSWCCKWRRERERGEREREREREREKAKCEINKIIVYTATLIVSICTVIVADV